ncbi:MAG: hypothetical protein WAO21_06200 [Verrucomicrobiia bacterium]
MNDELEGSIRIVKRLRNNEIWLRKDYGWAWIYLIGLATDRPRLLPVGGLNVMLKRGQLAWSERSLAHEFGQSRDWVRNLLKFCKEAEMISVDKTPPLSIITILNYEAYNPLPDSDDTSKTPAVPTSKTPTQPTTEPTIKEKVERGESPAPV